MDSKFDFILPDEDLSKNLGVHYASGVTTMNEEYDNMISKERPNDKDEVIYKYLNMNLIFDVGTNDKRRGTMVNFSWGLDRRAIGCLQTNPFFVTCEYKIKFTYGTRDNYAENINA